MRILDLAELTIGEIAPLIRKKKISPLELTKHYLDRIKRLDPALNAYVTVTEEQAIVDAKRAEKEISRGKYRGVLHGIPFSIKDNFATKGVRTTAGSKTLSEWVPDFDATAVETLKEEGAVILGKTHMHEWAKGSHTVNPFYATPYNPWDTKRVTGGSSSGSGVAVAADLCIASLGTDSAGSVRNPASLCGTVGLKPTFGRVSTYGGVPGTGGYSTNHFGILSKTVNDCALILQAIAGYDPKDPLSSDEPVPNYRKNIGKKVKGMRVGVLRGYFDHDLAGEVKRAFEEALKTLQSIGMKTEEVVIPHLELVPALQSANSRPEANSDHDNFLRTRPRDYSPGLLYNLVSGILIPASVYVTAQRVRRLLCQEFDAVLEKVQVIVAPTTPIPAPTVEECNRGYVEWDGRRFNLQDRRGNFLTQCTIPFNVTGLPAINICCGFSSLGLPIGMQIVAGPFQEGLVFQVAHAYEQATGWYKRKPPL